MTAGQRDISDSVLHHAVRLELEFEPGLDAARIGVVVNHGIVTLVGSTRTIEDKTLAGRVALRTRGARALVNHLAIDSDGMTRWSDEAIALNASEWLAQNLGIGARAVTISVEKGHVTLGGTLETDALKLRAEKEVSKLGGVGGVTNAINITGAVATDRVEREIREVLGPLGPLSDKAITVTTDHGSVTLDGRVSSWHAREEAERAAWRCLGVRHVENRLFVDW